MWEEHDVLAIFRSKETRSLLLWCQKTYLLFILFLCPVYFSAPIKSLFLPLSPRYLGLQPSWVFIVFCLPLCSARSTISPDCSLQILNQDIIRLFIFSKCFLFLRRGTKATSIISREVFLPNNISLNILRKNEMKTEHCQFSDSLGCSNNFLQAYCPIIAF